MTFEKVRQIGVSILASAGIAGIIIGFAAQRSLATLIAGIQIAITQPIRIDDVVIVDGLIRTLDLAVSIRIDKEEEENQDAIKNKVRDKLLRYMSADNRDFGEDLNVAELNRQIFEVEEVRYSSIDNLGQDVYLDFNEIAQLNNLTINVILID